GEGFSCVMSILELAGRPGACYTRRLGRIRGRAAGLQRDPQQATGQDRVIMPKLKTHKGIKKRFKVSATGKVSHKRCGSSHLNSHKSGKQVRRLRKKSTRKISAEAH